MKSKVILISIDGMRSDALQQCGNPFVKKLEQICTYNYDSRSVFPYLSYIRGTPRGTELQAVHGKSSPWNPSKTLKK